MFVKNLNLGADPNLGEITVATYYIQSTYWYKTYELLIQNLRTIATKLTIYWYKVTRLIEHLCQAQSTDLRDLPIAQRNLRIHTLRN